MTSSTNLLDLVNHLHNLESSVGKILIESAVKLSQLIDLNFFVIVESQDGRKFAGTSDLCDAYAASSLNPRGNDIHINVLDNQTVVEQPLNVIAPTAGQNVAGGSSGEHGVTPSINAIYSPIISASSSTPSGERKRGSLSRPDLSHVQSKIRKLNSSLETADDGCVKLESECHVISDDDDETVDDIKSFDAFYPRGLEMSSGSFCPTSSLSIDYNPDLESLTAAHNIQEAEDWRRGGNKMFLGPLLPPVTLENTMCQKMRGLLSINSNNVFDKTTSEYRLFASTVYDFGKHIYHYAPSNKDLKDLTVVAFITECVNEFLKQHPFLAESDTCETKVNGLTVTGFIRDRVKGGFKRRTPRNGRSNGSTL